MHSSDSLLRFDTGCIFVRAYSVIAGHMSINRPDSQWKLLLNTIRAKHEDVPVFIFGGHNHVRNCERLDGRSIS